MSFSRSSEAPPILSNTEADSEVARPGPKYGGVREGDIKMLTVTSQIGVPDGLGVHECVEREGENILFVHWSITYIMYIVIV